jgi:aryl-alcohol dehydrogenase-like predicted oxidoreductase
MIVSTSLERICDGDRDSRLRQVGVSNFDVAEIEEFAYTRLVGTLQPPYSLFRCDVETVVLPYACAHDVGVLVYGSLVHGLLSGSMDERATLANDDWRSTNPSFDGETFRSNLAKVRDLRRFADEQFGSSVAAFTGLSPDRMTAR